jgi:outer membrane protein assembly factor BamB/precorrin-6B methylase 2
MSRCLILTAIVGSVLGQSAVAVDWPMLGHDGTRNSVSGEEGAPVAWRIEQRRDGQLIRGAKGVRWSAKLGSATFSSPVVSGGLVWIGTNNSRPGVKQNDTEGSALLCFRAEDGKQVYQYVSPRFGTSRIQDSGFAGLGSSPLTEGDRLWIVTNRSEVLCLDIGPLQRGDGAPRELWKLDLVKEFDIFPRIFTMGPARPCSIGPSWKGRIFVTTNNGVDQSYAIVPKPNAPSLVCLDKNTGKVHWKDNSPGGNVLLTQLASPTVAEIGGRVQVVVPQSDGWTRSFDPQTGEKLWEFDVNPKASRYDIRGVGNRNCLMGNAVVYEGRVYVASGNDPERGDGIGRLVCIDPTKRGDVSSELAVDSAGKPLARRRVQAVNEKEGEKAIPNPNSALIWEFVRCGADDFLDVMHRSMGSVAIANGLVIAADFSGIVHCLDAKTGKRHWSHDALAAIWATPLIVGDKVYVADEDGGIAVFQLSADPKHAEPLATTTHSSSICASPVYANGTLYVANRNTLFAVDAASARRFGDEAAHWPQWRGSKRDNRSSDTGLLASWPADGPPLAWRVDGLGDGIASVALANDRIFTCTTYRSGEYAFALDEATGERLWATRVGSAVEENLLMRWLGQRTPTVDGNRLYAFTNAGWLVCLEADTGSVLWRVSYPHEFGARPGNWGFCDRPLVDGERLVCVPGGSSSTLAVLDKRSGKVIWTKLLEHRESAAYGAPLIVETDGLKQYVAFLHRGLVSFAADDGRLLWRYDRIANGIGNSYTPIALADGLLCPNGYGRGVARLKLTRRNSDIVYEEVYFQPETLDPFEDSTVVVDGRLYAFRTGGLLQCFNVADGARLWGPVRRGGSGKAAGTYADGHLYIRWEDGTLGLVQTHASEYVESGRFKLGDPRKSLGSTFPVVAGGRLYVRDNDRLYCYDVTQHPADMPAPKTRFVKLAEPNAPPNADVSTPRGPSAIFVPTPSDVVERMLTAAGVRKDDVVYDLGSGDGRIVIEAARKYGCRAVGLEIDRDLVSLSRERARESKVEKLVTIGEADLFARDFNDASVVAVYLYPQLLKRLLPKFDQLRPGTRIVAHQFEIPDVRPEKTIVVESKETGAKHTIYVWTIPLNKPMTTPKP